MLLTDVKIEMEDLKNIKVNEQKYNPLKKTIVIVDDNEGICLFLKEDLYIITDKNILTFSGINAVYECIKFCEDNNIVPEYCILDIIFNGLIIKNKENIKLNGIHLLEYFLSKKKVNYCFFTGSLSKTSTQFQDQFYKLTKEDIMNHVIPKLVLNYKERTKKLQEMLEL